MSGGVDSSVAAALLKKHGYDVIGVFFKPWLSEDGRAFCNWQEDKSDAARVAAKLGIKFKVWDFSKEYGDKVTKYMISSYHRGATPNPDVMCNKEIKFGLFLKKALAEGADYIATGHYARLGREISNSEFQIPNKSKIQNSKNRKPQAINRKLLKGVDNNKDQSYFLWTLTQRQLKYCLFPIGNYVKSEVRGIAKKFGFHIHAKKDSQGICFVGQLDVKEFLERYIKPKSGEIQLVGDEDALEGGKVIQGLCQRRWVPKAGTISALGRHDGVYYYTIGQRHGLDIKTGGGPYFVAGKDIKKNIIYVSKNVQSLLADKLIVKKASWIGGAPELPLKAQVQIRYRSKPVPAVISRIENGGVLLVKFKRPACAVTPGQSAVFYRGQEVLGGGVII